MRVLSHRAGSARLAAMDRQQIFRDDFPTARKGWDPEAVSAHLRAVAEGIPDPSEAPAPVAAPDPKLADVAAERVRVVIDAAEQAADGIESQARAEAAQLVSSAKADSEAQLSSARSESEGMLSSARSESESLLSSSRAESEQMLNSAREESERMRAEARDEAAMRVEQARAAVSGLISQADELRDRVGILGDELAGSIRSSAASVAEITPPVVVPEPTPAPVPEPTPDPVPEPTPEPIPEPTPDPVPEPTPDPTPEPEPEPEPEPPAPEPAPDPPVVAEEPATLIEEIEEDSAPAGGESTEDLIAQLRGGGSSAPEGAAPAVSSSDLGAARLVAMNMALEGASREQISAQLESEFGVVPDQDGLLDEVFARAGR